jgi:hypothetical protein
VPLAASTGARRSLPPRRVKPSGRWGVWLDARLTAKVMTQREAYDALRDRWPALFPWGESSIDSFRAYIRGKEPDPEQQAAFIELFGGPGPDMARSGESTPPDLAAALIALTAELEAIRLEREAWRRGVVEVLRSYEAGQVPEGLLDALAPRLPEDARP